MLLWGCLSALLHAPLVWHLRVNRWLEASGTERANRMVREGVLEMPFREASFDPVLCQLALQLFPDRPQALREMFRVLGSAGRLTFSVFREIDRTPMAHAFAEALDKRIRPGASKLKRVEHGFYDAGELRDLATDAGCEEAMVMPVIRDVAADDDLHLVRAMGRYTPTAAYHGRVVRAQQTNGSRPAHQPVPFPDSATGIVCRLGAGRNG